MRLTAMLLATALLAAGPVAAEEEPEDLTIEDAAAKVAEAISTPNPAELKRLAALGAPDPWLVVEELGHLDQREAALGFAKAAPRPDPRLLAYIGAWSARTPEDDDRKLLLDLYALLPAEGFPADVAKQIAERTASLADAKPTTVTRIDVLGLRADALEALQRHADREAVLMQTAHGARDLGWLTQAEMLYHRAAQSAQARHQAWATALAAWEGFRDVCKDLGGDKRARWAAEAESHIGLLHLPRGNYQKALDAFTRAREQEKTLGRPLNEAQALNNMGLIHVERGDYTQAHKSHAEARAMFQALGEAGKLEAAVALGNMGKVHLRRGEYGAAWTDFADAYDALTTLETRDEAKEAELLGHMGHVKQLQGDYPAAQTKYVEALRLQVEHQQKLAEADTRGRVGSLLLAQGKYADAILAYEQALEIATSLESKPTEALVLRLFGDAYQLMGDYPRALARYQESLTLTKALGLRPEEARTLVNLGSAYQSSKSYREALDTYELALKMMEDPTLGLKADAATTLGNIGVARDALGMYDKALEAYEEARERHGALGNTIDWAMTHGNIGEVHQHLGTRLLKEGKEAEAEASFTKALAMLLESVEETFAQNAKPQYVAALGMLARLHLERNRPAEALAETKRALEAVETLLKGLADEQGATAREPYADVPAIGALAAKRLKSEADTCRFLEAGRAGALIGMLGTREAMAFAARSRDVELVQLQRAVAELEAELRTATADQRDKAQEALRRAEERVELWAKNKNDLGAFRPKTLLQIRRSLAKGQALVLYGVFHDDKGLDEALALVIRSDGARIVELEPASVIAEACQPLTDGPRTEALAKARGWDAPRQEAKTERVTWRTAMVRVRELLVTPLGLAEDIEQVLVSPEGPLCYLPFGALFVDQAVVLTPSGTTLVMVRRDLQDNVRAPGEGILALGNPDYEGRAEASLPLTYEGKAVEDLPGTGVEVAAIGDETLVGAAASEAGLREALPKAKRWRAIHFACHGYVNNDRPMLSSLALSRPKGGVDNGFLTAREIMDMETRMPTDLAVLSACNSSRGRIRKGEGIVGFTRALMFAGAPRVICSLWKADDEATAALMIKFYELWNPKDGVAGIGVAAALRQAQAYVRAQAKWKKPYYWAGWVLWGLPDDAAAR